MKIGRPIDERLPWARAIHDLDDAWNVGTLGPQAKALRAAGERLGDELREGPRVVAVRTISLTTLPYPTKFAFQTACPLPVPYIVMTHRALLVQVLAEGELKNVLFNPTDYEAAEQTPFFKQLAERAGAIGKWLHTQWGPIEQQLEALGVAPEDIDVIAFDHFHTQDLRTQLGCSRMPDGRSLPARFPNAHLLAPRKEWEDWDDLHPMQRAWFLADGKKGVPEERVILTEGDVALGDGCLLLRTPGHTSGNQTLVVHGEQGVFGCCENGTSSDNWAPAASTIPGVRKHARFYDVEVVLNSNTPEMGAVQYNSMILERSIVDRVPGRPEFVQMFPSSECTPSRMAPGIRPAMVFGDRDSGTLQHDRAARDGAGAAVAASAERV